MREDKEVREDNGDPEARPSEEAPQAAEKPTPEPTIESTIDAARSAPIEHASPDGADRPDQIGGSTATPVSIAVEPVSGG